MDGQKNFFAANFATSFRRALMAEHLGISPNDPVLDDPVSNTMFDFINQTARQNTQMYHNIFGCYPDDAYTDIKILQEAKKMKQGESPETLLNNYNKFSQYIRGHIVEYPLLFLQNEELGKSFCSVENLVPEYNFT